MKANFIFNKAYAYVVMVCGAVNVSFDCGLANRIVKATLGRPPYPLERDSSVAQSPQWAATVFFFEIGLRVARRPPSGATISHW